MRRYKELRYDGKIYNETYKIDKILIDGGFEWFLDCEVENVRMEIQFETLIFNSGVFFNGTWYYGVFRDGEWKNGTWNNGVWYNGIWRNGTFESGLIFDGRFFNGKIEKGTIRGGEFFDMIIDKEVVREDNYKLEKDEDVQPVEPTPINEELFPEPEYNEREPLFGSFKDIFKRKKKSKGLPDYKNPPPPPDAPSNVFTRKVSWKKSKRHEEDEVPEWDKNKNPIRDVEKFNKFIKDRGIGEEYDDFDDDTEDGGGYDPPMNKHGKFDEEEIEDSDGGNNPLDPYGEEDWDEKDTEELNSEEQKKRDYVTDIIVKIDKVVDRLLDMTISEYVKSPYFLTLSNRNEIVYKKKLRNSQTVTVKVGNYDLGGNNIKDTYDFKIGEDTHITDVNLSLDSIDIFNGLRDKVDVLSKRILKRNSFDNYDDIFEGKKMDGFKNFLKNISPMSKKNHNMPWKDVVKYKLNDKDYLDPFEEEDWDEKEFIGLELFLSEKQKPLYKDGKPFKIWKEKYHVLFKKGDKYYILGDYRFGSNDFKMFYEDYTGIERKDLREYKGEIYRPLEPKEKSQVMKTLSNGIKFTRDLFDDENGKRYDEILDDFINESLKTKKYYKVVTEDLKSLGLRKNPTILTFPEDVWVNEPNPTEDMGGWGGTGGIWVANSLSGGKGLLSYMKKKSIKENAPEYDRCRLFEVEIGKVLFSNSYRTKTDRVKLIKEII